MGNLKFNEDILHYKKFVDFQEGLIKLRDKADKKKADIDNEEYFKLFHNIYDSLNAWNKDFLWITNIYYDYLKTNIIFDKNPLTFSKKHKSDKELFQKMEAVFKTKEDENRPGIYEFFTNIIFPATSNKRPLEIEMCQAKSFKFSFDETQGKLHVTFPLKPSSPNINKITSSIISKDKKKASSAKDKEISDKAIKCITEQVTDYAQCLLKADKKQHEDVIKDLNNYFGLSNSKEKFEVVGILVQILVNILFSSEGLKHLYFLPALCTSGVPGVGGFILATKENVEIDHIKYLLYVATTAYEKLSSRLLQKYADDIQERTTLIAIISILVDSFAHNIAAHSLSAMVWFLKQQRQKQIDSASPYDILCKGKFSDLKKEIENSAEKQHLLYLINEIDNNFIKIAPLEGSVQYAQYLCNKAAFWSGVTRDFECGGEIRSWYDVLKDFAENSIYLGTIAHAEGIHKVRLKVGYGEEKDSEQKTEDFAVAKFDTSEHVSGTTFMKSYKKDENKNKSTPWTDLDKDKWKLFLPNGIVGLHALYTIFENTIRNIKHAAPKELEKAKKDGIEFNIFIQSDDKHFNTTIWLGNKSKIMEEKKDEKGKVVKAGVDERISKLLKEDIVTGNGTPRMGGNSQDKICASMLYNNVFSKVDVNDQNNSKRPDQWIGVKRDLENSQELGVIKRSFYMWKGSNAVELIPDAADTEDVERTTSAISSEDEEEIVKIKVGELDYENPARFKFVIVPKSEEDTESESVKEEQGLKGKLAVRGIVRIMEKSECSGDDLDSLYKPWNKKWIKCDRDNFCLTLNETPTNLISKENGLWTIKFFPGVCGEAHQIAFNHGNASNRSRLNCKSQSSWIEKFMEDFSSFEIKEGKFEDEFIETLLTDIKIYDNRIHERVKTSEKKRPETNLIDLYAEQLFLHVYDENMKRTDFIQKVRNNKANFIVIHLSYIESMNFSEKNINKFIETCGIFFNYNTKLVITTGRGRGEWHNSLDAKYKKHVLFKPIDSLLAAVEDGLMLNDDFQVKYNLVKVLFGS